jgi:hypothetical protein
MELYIDVEQQLMDMDIKDYPEIKSMILRFDSLRNAIVEMESSQDSIDEDHFTYIQMQHYNLETEIDVAISNERDKIIEKSEITLNKYRNISNSLSDYTNGFREVFYQVLESKFNDMLSKKEDPIPGISPEVFKNLLVQRAELLTLVEDAQELYYEEFYDGTMTEERKAEIEEPYQNKINEILAQKGIEEINLENLEALIDQNFVVYSYLEGIASNRIKID